MGEVQIFLSNTAPFLPEVRHPADAWLIPVDLQNEWKLLRAVSLHSSYCNGLLNPIYVVTAFSLGTSNSVPRQKKH